MVFDMSGTVTKALLRSVPIDIAFYPGLNSRMSLLMEILWQRRLVHIQSSEY